MEKEKPFLILISSKGYQAVYMTNEGPKPQPIAKSAAEELINSKIPSVKLD